MGMTPGEGVATNTLYPTQPDQQGIEQYFNLWAHLEHPVRIKINGDEANSIALHDR